MEQNAKKGNVVADGQGQGNTLKQLSCPNELFVDILGAVYVADYSNHRVMRRTRGEEEDDVIEAGNGRRQGASQLYRPKDLSFDQDANLDVVDGKNNHIQRFSIK